MEKTNPRQRLTTAHSSSTDSGRKRPLIVFDGSSTNTGSIKLKKADDVLVTDPLKSPPSNINLSNPIRKLSGSSTNSSTNSSSSSTSTGSARSPTGNGSLNSASAPNPVQFNCLSMKLKRGASSSGVPESPELKSPEAKKKIQHVTWP
ncbi:ashwin [Tachysurus ichikawai]